MDEEGDSRVIDEIECLFGCWVCSHNDHWIWVEGR